MQEAVKQGKLVMLGVIQEQHAERCRLYAQWQQLNWPILHDPLNLMRTSGVPIFVAIDEHGIIREVNPSAERFENDFINKKFPVPGRISKEAKPAGITTPNASNPNDSATSDNLIRQANELALWKPNQKLDEAIQLYSRVLQKKPEHGVAHFRLGVCYRMRFDSASGRWEDFRRSVQHWEKALEISPNEYIWRRRIQQYGPRLNKPYPFYDWVAKAQQEIRRRGDEPIKLSIPLTESELALPASDAGPDTSTERHPDPRGRIRRDIGGLVTASTAVVPAQAKPGKSVRAYVRLSPSLFRESHWTNDAGPTTLWIELPKGWRTDQKYHKISSTIPETSQESREFEFELFAPPQIDSGPVTIRAFALYYVCEDVHGVCQYLRQDIPIVVHIVK